jgi:hypothetical protein
MAATVHPEPAAPPLESVHVAAGVGSADGQLDAVLAQLRSHTRHAINRGLSLEQLFRYFANNRDRKQPGSLPRSAGKDEQPEITPAMLHETLMEVYIPSTPSIAKKLVTKFSNGGCVLLPEHFNRLVMGPSKTQSQRRVLIPKGLTSQRSKSFRVLPTFSGEDDQDKDSERDPMLINRFQLSRDQIVVHDDPDFAECFIPLQVSDLCDRLAYESRHDPIFAEHFEALSGMMRKLIYVRLYASATDAFQLYADHDPDGDQQRTMRAKDYISLSDVVGEDAEHSQTLNVRLFEQVLASFCTDANFMQIADESLDQNWTKALGSSLNLQLDWEKKAVEMKAFERGRRLVDSHVELNFANLWGWLLPWSVVFLSPRHLCESSKRKRQLWSDNFGDWPPAQPSSSGGGSGQDGDENDDDDDEAERAARRGCCACANRCWIPWRAIGGPHTWYYRSPVDGTLVQRRRVFSRLLVQFRVDDPEALGVENRGFVRRLASRHLAASGGAKNAYLLRHFILNWSFCQDRLGTNIGKVEKRVAFFAGGQAKVDLDGKPVSHTNRAKEQSSQFVFLKLFKDFPIDEIELARQENAVLFVRLFINCIILPRQARGAHRENHSKKSTVVLQAVRRA